MTPRRRRLLVGVVLHTDAAALHATLDALDAAVAPDDRVVLVPDGPDAPMVEALATDPRLHQLPQLLVDQPCGNAAAFNRLAAALQAGDRAMVFLESGSRPAPDALARLAAALDAPGVGLAGPSTDDAWNEQRALPPGCRDPADLASCAAGLAAVHGDGHRSLAPLHSIAELCIAVAPEALAAVGGADEGFGLGPCWEMEYAGRAARAGREAVWVGAAYVQRAPPTRRRLENEARWFVTARRRYQDRLCGLRLDGTATAYDDHCTGEACPHFAPPDRIVLHLPIPSCDLPREAPRHIQVTGRSRAPGPVPLVSAVMPTADRPDWVTQAVRYFHRQDHPAKELVVVDDGGIDLGRELGDLLDHPDITYLRLPARVSIGAKRNLGCQRGRGDVLVQWDDDDWYGPGRLRHQVQPIAAGEADITGLRDALWFDVTSWRFRRPTPDAHRRLFVEDVHGGTLAFRRSVWERGSRYPDLSLAEDAWFLQTAVRRGARLGRLAAEGLYLYVRHGTNSWQLAPAWARPDAWDAVAEPAALAVDRDFYAARAASATATPTAGPWRPAVSCVMPTANRHEFLPAAIAGFLAQTFADAELVVVDDGAESAGHLVPADPRIAYIRLDQPCLLGEKRNLAVEAARAEVVVHLDDDDWSHPDRLRVQVDTLRSGRGELCGLARMLWWDPRRRAAWRYTCPPVRRPWVAGNTLAYLRSSWQQAPFPAQAVGEDTAFVWGHPGRRVVPIDDERLVIGTLHERNTSTKHTRSSAWEPIDPAEVLQVFADTEARGMARRVPILG